MLMSLDEAFEAWEDMLETVAVKVSGDFTYDEMKQAFKAGAQYANDLHTCADPRRRLD